MCENYKGVTLLNTAYKLYDRIINNRLKKVAEVLLLDEQNGFRKGRSCNENIAVIRQFIEKHREYNIESHIGFIDYEKAFDRVNRNILWGIMEYARLSETFNSSYKVSLSKYGNNNKYRTRQNRANTNKHRSKTWG